MSFGEFIGNIPNRGLAKALDLIAPRLDSELAQWLLHEAAKRLRGDEGEPDPHYVEPPPPGLPPLKAYAVPDLADPEPAQDSLSPGKQIGECIHEIVGAVIERHDG